MGVISYVSQLFMGEMFLMQEIYMHGRREGETVTPSQCGRVDSPGDIDKLSIYAKAGDSTDIAVS